MGPLPVRTKINDTAVLPVYIWASSYYKRNKYKTLRKLKGFLKKAESGSPSGTSLDSPAHMLLRKRVWQKRFECIHTKVEVSINSRATSWYCYSTALRSGTHLATRVCWERWSYGCTAISSRWSSDSFTLRNYFTGMLRHILPKSFRLIIKNTYGLHLLIIYATTTDWRHVGFSLSSHSSKGNKRLKVWAEGYTKTRRKCFSLHSEPIAVAEASEQGARPCDRGWRSGVSWMRNNGDEEKKPLGRWVNSSSVSLWNLRLDNIVLSACTLVTLQKLERHRHAAMTMSHFFNCTIYSHKLPASTR